jgi:hypothetical protein
MGTTDRQQPIFLVEIFVQAATPVGFLRESDDWFGAPFERSSIDVPDPYAPIEQSAQ